MDTNSGGWGAVQLPSTSPALGQVLESEINQNYRSKQYEAQNAYRMQAMQQRAEQQKQEDEAKKQKSLLDAFDPKNEMTGVQRIDAVTQKALADGYNDLFARSKNMTLAEIQAEAAKIVAPIHQGDLLAKQKYVDAQARIKEYATRNKNFNVSAATRDAQNEVANMFLLPEEGGGIKYKPIDQINHDFDITGKLLDPNNRWKYAVDGDYLKKEIMNTKGDERNYFYRDPNTQTITQFKGNMPAWAEETVIPDARGLVKGIPSFKLKTEKIDSRDGQGRPVKIDYLNPEQQANILNSDEKLDSFNKMYNEMKQRKGISTLPPQDEEILRGSFLADFIRQNDKNQPRPTNIQQPQRWQIYPNGTGGSNKNGGGAGSGEDFVNAYSEITKRASETESRGRHNIPVNELSYPTQQALIDIVHKVHGGKGTDPTTGAIIPLDNSDIYIAKENGNLLVRKTTPKPDGSGFEPANNSRDQLIAPLDKMGLNLSANKSMGMKAKKAVVSGGNDGNAPSGVKPINPTKRAAPPKGINVDDLRSKYKY